MNAPLACRWQVKCGSHTHTQKQNQKTHTKKNKKTHTSLHVALGPCMCVCIFLRVSNQVCARVLSRVVLLYTSFVTRILLRACLPGAHTCFVACVAHVLSCVCLVLCVCVSLCILTDLLLCRAQISCRVVHRSLVVSGISLGVSVLLHACQVRTSGVLMCRLLRIIGLFCKRAL